MLYDRPPIHLTPLRRAMAEAYRMDEATVVSRLLADAALPPEVLARILARATTLVETVRSDKSYQGGLDAILRQYDLSSEEGVALMCVAEALLRIPDSATVDKLLEDRLTSVDWSQHLGKSRFLFANAVTWSLLLTGKLYSPVSEAGLLQTLKNVMRKSSGTIVRPAVRKFMEFLGRKFVMGETIEEGLKRAGSAEKQGYRYSYDMLGEAARTEEDALHYLASYHHALEKIGEYAKGLGPIKGPGISIKLSALHPRYELANKARVMQELLPRLRELVVRAKEYNIGLTIDAEEASRLDLSLDLIEAVFDDATLAGWEGFGVAVQSYQKRAPFVLEFLHELAKRCKRRIMVRLIKGAYWDYEIKISQELGLPSYPVFTRKNTTDVSFIACAKKLISYNDWIYPQFATHNAYSIAVILELIGNHPFEFQCLHGMGQKLYDHIVGEKNLNLPCRIYAPVGTHDTLLGYLMRRLLENGANTSFVNLIANRDIVLSELLINPVERIAKLKAKAHPHIPLPKDIYGHIRLNSTGFDLTNMLTLASLKEKIEAAGQQTFTITALIHDKKTTGTADPITSPIDHKTVGTVVKATETDVDIAFGHALAAFAQWEALPLLKRAECLERAADLLEKETPVLLWLLIREAGKTLPAAIAEVREAVDYCRYYAVISRRLHTQVLQGPTGELDQLSCHGRGVFVCISPWNFPLAIFMGQVVAALVAGNTVIAKPADQTPIIAWHAVRLLHQAGVPTDVLQFLPGRGSVIGARLVQQTKIGGVMFTGSTETARLINQTLAKREGAIVPFVAETGGQNVMIVDSSALPEQVVADVVGSAFDSTGQRCSALRVLFLQEEVADKIITMLIGAMKELKVGDPAWLNTDVGPVIDASSLATLQAHVVRMKQEGKLLHQCAIDSTLPGHFFAPCAFEIPSLSLLTREVFGPILHVIRYRANAVDEVIHAINHTGYGLTLGIHSRIRSFAEHIINGVHIGNIYVNRNMIGAVVGVQPFGGEGLSGTGPKAGGPHYLYRLCTERSLSVNTTAAGGNATLLTLTEDDEKC